MKQKTKRITALALTALLCTAAGASGAAPAPEKDYTGVISPQNLVIAQYDSRLTIDSDGMLTCYGKTSVQSGYTAYVVVELKDASGKTLATWTDEGKSFAEVDKKYRAVKGNSYTLTVTHRAYNTNGTIAESFSIKSKTVKY